MKATSFLTLRGSNVPHRSSSLHPSVTSYSPLRRSSYVPLRLSSTVHAGALTSNLGSQGKPMDDNGYMENAFKFVTLFPLEEKYSKELKRLLPIFSMYGFFRNRMIVQVEWLLKQSDISELKVVPKFSHDARDYLKNLLSEFPQSDMYKVMYMEDINIGAVLNYLKERSRYQFEEISKALQNYQFACTPEVINLAYGMMLNDAKNEVYPVMTKICETLSTIIQKKKNEMGEELSFPADELSNKIRHLRSRADRVREIHISEQFKGEGGNDNAKIDSWPRIAEEFVTSLGLKFQPNINPEDHICMFFDDNMEFNTMQFTDEEGNYFCANSIDEIVPIAERYLTNSGFKSNLNIVKDYICLLYGSIIEFNSFLSDISGDYLQLMVKEGDRMEFERKINLLSPDHMLKALKSKRPFKTHTRHPFVVDLVGVIGYSFVRYQGMLEELEKLL